MNQPQPHDPTAPATLDGPPRFHPHDACPCGGTRWGHALDRPESDHGGGWPRFDHTGQRPNGGAS